MRRMLEITLRSQDADLEKQVRRAGVTPYTSTFVFAECCVFDKQSQRPGF